jgi:phosphoglycolate phosphatase-like HAD superfamily hydrolase
LSLKELRKEKDFLIGIDSDGCVFDTMELKVKECIIPNLINDWGLQAISKYAREVAEFVNLYSVWRGINRFPALIKVFELLAERKEVIQREFKIPELTLLKKWIATETKLCNPALLKMVQRTRDPLLTQTLQWSTNVHESLEKIVHGVPPFPSVGQNLKKMAWFADTMVISTTTNASLAREWGEHDIAKYVKVLAGQEMGVKKETLAHAKNLGYADDHVLMIGDARGDLEAAKVNQILFYPIIPGSEVVSWERFYEEALEKLINCQYAGDYEQNLIIEFEKRLPETPPWC